MENIVSQKLWKFSNPVLFKRLAKIISPIAGLIAVLAIIPGLVWGVFFTSPDYKQMETVKIIFIHVPAAFLAINIYLMMTITSLVWLIRRHYVSALAAKSSAMIGLTMTIVTVITGSLWGSSTWGTYWVWDPRLTSFAIFLCFFRFFFIQTSIFQFKNRCWGQHFFVKIHNILSFRYRKIDFGCLKWSRMIPGTKKTIQTKFNFSITIRV